MICRYESEFSRLLKDENDRFAFTVKGSEFLRKDGIMEKFVCLEILCYINHIVLITNHTNP